MKNVLDKIIANKKIEVERHKAITSISQLEERIIDRPLNSFRKALIDSSTGIIAEFKRKSPSKGWIFEDAKVEDVLPLYEQNGATASSVLTDYDFFGGTFSDFEKARSLVNIPLLRKDFMIDEYQLYEAKVLQADVILLIASALSVEETKSMAQKAHGLGLEVLLEIHNENELNHINEYVDVVGVNNRNLDNFVTDIQVSFDLSQNIPNEFLKISESGISNHQTIIELQGAGYKGFLMGENFMKTANPGQALADFIGQLK